MITSQKLTLKKDLNYSDLLKTVGSEITCSLDVSKIARVLFSENLEVREEFHILCLSNSHTVIGHAKISEGGLTSTIVDGKLVFRTALLNSNCTAIILIHNHPSGKLQASASDETLTDSLVKFGKMIDLTVLDHLIITPDSYLSFKDECLM